MGRLMGFKMRTGLLSGKEYIPKHAVALTTRGCVITVVLVSMHLQLNLKEPVLCRRLFFSSLIKAQQRSSLPAVL